MGFNDRRAFINITGGAMFWIFMLVLVLTAAWVWVNHPPSVLSEVLNGTSEERELRNLQDPLAMRLWAVSRVPFGFGESIKVQGAVDAVIRQWSEEVRDLKEKAYHTKAAEMSWDISKLNGLTEEQKKVAERVKDKQSTVW